MGTFNTGAFNTQQFNGGTSPNGLVSGLDIIYVALRLVRILPEPGRGPSPEKVSDAFDALNTMIDSWNLEQLLVPATVRSVYPLVSGQGIYQYGAAALDWVGQWAQRFHAVGLLITEETGLPYELPIKQLELEEWERIRFKNQTSTLPTRSYYDGGFPAGNLHLWPWPTDPNSIVLYVGQTLAGFAQPTDKAILYPGYLKAIQYNLAVELAPRWPEAVLTETVQQIAIDSKGLIKSRNLKPGLLRCDDGVVVRAGGTWNWLTGEP